MNGSFEHDWDSQGDGPVGDADGLCGLDDELVERLLECTDAASLPVAVRPLADILVAVRAPATADELAGEADAVAQFRTTRSRQTLASTAHPRHGRRRSTALVVAATLAFISATSAAAAAGTLPDDLQDMASQMLSKIGITVPNSSPDHPPTHPGPNDREHPLPPTPAANSTTDGNAESDATVPALDARTSTTRRRNSTVDPAPAAPHDEAAITETPITVQQEQPVEPLDSTPTDVEPASPGTPTTTQTQPSTAPTPTPPPPALAASEPNTSPSAPPSEPPPPTEDAPPAPAPAGPPPHAGGPPASIPAGPPPHAAAPPASIPAGPPPHAAAPPASIPAGPPPHAAGPPASP